MASDYDFIRQENERKYGTDIGRIGPMLLTHRYADRAHFIYELLQNAEDALDRRGSREGSRTVQFKLSHESLRISHFGAQFTEGDVRGICGIAESTKDHFAIGRFGIGFKSVYAFTDRPSVSSGDEHFSIENFVWPRKQKPCADRADETVFVLPFRKDDAEAASDIAAGLRQLGPRTLLFLRHIDSVSWDVVDGPSGTYMRDVPEVLAPNVRRVRVLGEEHGRDLNVDETWMIFKRPILGEGDSQLGRVEIAFLCAVDGADRSVGVRPVSKSSLVVFFPTIVETHLGFVLQGPYRTTPSRDNVHTRDEWNQRLVRETAELVVDAVRYLRDVDALSAQALAALPLDREMFAGGSFFAPIFEATRTVLRAERVLPAHGGGYVYAGQARIARGQELRNLFSSQQLADLFGTGEGTGWVTGEVTQDRTPELRDYLMREVGVPEERPESVIRRLTTSFLEAQPDAWIATLYRYLRTQSELMRYGPLRSLPLIRLEDGTHLPAFTNDQPQVFLPTSTTSECLTVRRSLCEDEEVRAFLEEVGLKEPDAIEEVLRVILPRYEDNNSTVLPDTYAADIEHLLHAFGSDTTTSRRDLLRARLSDSYFVGAIEMGSGMRTLARPEGLYLATQQLKELFESVAGVWLVDDSVDVLRGEAIRDMLGSCGAKRNIDAQRIQPGFDYRDLEAMRAATGDARYSYDVSITDYTLRGLEALLQHLPSLPFEDACRRLRVFWDELCAFANRSTSAFHGVYAWFYYSERHRRFDAQFIRLLNDIAWVPTPSGALERPCNVVFETIDPAWTDSAFLLSRIHFRPPAVELLAKEAGIDPELIALLRKMGITTEAGFRLLVDIEEPATSSSSVQADSPATTIDSTTPEEQLRAILGDDYQQPSAPSEQPQAPAGSTPAGDGGAPPEGHAGVHGGGGAFAAGRLRRLSQSGDGATPKKRTPGGEGGRPFVSYVGAHANDEPFEEEDDPDGLDSQRRAALEEFAIRHVLASEPTLRRTPKNNAGYDLEDPAAGNSPHRWIEVKAMTGLLRDRSVGLSRTQFDYARLRGPAYWLYIVERAGTKGSEKVWRIQDPAGKAKTFTFDHGWLEIADGDRANDEGHTEEETEP